MIRRMLCSWPPRDFRLLAAMVLLAGGGPAMLLFAWYLVGQVARLSTGPWPLAYALYGALFIILSIVTGMSAVLGRRASSFSISRDGASASSQGGGDDPAGVS